MENDFLTAEELAARLNVKTETVRQWLRAGLIPAIRLTRKTVRYNLDAVVNSLRKRQEGDHDN